MSYTVGNNSMSNTDTQKTTDTSSAASGRVSSGTLLGARLTKDPMETKQKKTYEEHRERHLKLHRMLDELCADWIWETGGMPSKATVLDLIIWSHEQTLDPSDKDGRFLPPNNVLGPTDLRY